MSSRRNIRAIARLLLGVMLFAQAALALAACNWSHREPARAVAAMEEMACCAEGEEEGALPGNANLCLAHCTSDAQLVDTYPIMPIVAPVAFLVTLPMPPDERVIMRRVAVRGIASPPRIILFQNLRI